MSVATALAQYQDQFDGRLVSLVRASRGRVPSLNQRLDAAGLTGEVSVGSDLDNLPVLSKDSLPGLQRENPPFGGLVADDATVVRLFASPGPIYEPQTAGPDPWGWRPALSACGIAAGDLVLNCFSYHLSPAGVMFDEACRAVGAAVVPGGVGMADVQAQAIADLGVSAYIGLPSYLATLVESYDQLGLPAPAWLLSKALVTAEPLTDALRASLMVRVPTVLMAYGTAEAGLLGYETAPGDGLLLSTRTYVQICDPSSGKPVASDEPGEVVASVLDEDYPLLRFGTGDVSRWRLGPDGSLRLAGVLGRVGAAVKVRGMFVHPHQAREVVASLRDVGAAGGRFVVLRDGDKDRLTLELVASGTGADGDLVATAERITQQRLRVRAQVRLVESVEGDEVLVDHRA